MSTPSVRPVRASARARGFTILEVVTVVLIIGILMATALPSFIARIGDRRANEKAQYIALFYKNARSRALGRGAAQMVRFDRTSYLQGELLLFEAIQTPPQGNTPQVGGCGQLPVAQCQIAAWDTCVGGAMPQCGAGARFVDFFPRDRTDLYAQVWATFYPPGGNLGSGDAGPTVELCFTPLGKTWMRAPGNPWTDLTSLVNGNAGGVPFIAVQRKNVPGTQNVGIVRTVLLPPNGEARLFL